MRIDSKTHGFNVQGVPASMAHMPLVDVYARQKFGTVEISLPCSNALGLKSTSEACVRRHPDIMDCVLRWHGSVSRSL